MASPKEQEGLAYGAAEFIHRMGLVLVVHEKTDLARRYQTAVMHASVDHKQPFDARGLVIRSSIEDDIVPVPYDQFKWEPRHNMPTTNGIVSLIARVPITAENYNVSNGESAQLWNDVFLEFEYESPNDSRSKRFLLNSRGLVAYNEAGDIAEDWGYEDTHDLFIVRHPVVAMATLDTTEVTTLLDGPNSYVLAQQDNS